MMRYQFCRNTSTFNVFLLVFQFGNRVGYRDTFDASDFFSKMSHSQNIQDVCFQIPRKSEGLMFSILRFDWLGGKPKRESEVCVRVRVCVCSKSEPGDQQSHVLSLQP